MVTVHERVGTGRREWERWYLDSPILIPVGYSPAVVKCCVAVHAAHKQPFFGSPLQSSSGIEIPLPQIAPQQASQHRVSSWAERWRNRMRRNWGYVRETSEFSSRQAHQTLCSSLQISTYSSHRSKETHQWSGSLQGRYKIFLLISSRLPDSIPYHSMQCVGEVACMLQCDGVGFGQKFQKLNWIFHLYLDGPTCLHYNRQNLHIATIGFCLDPKCTFERRNLELSYPLFQARKAFLNRLCPCINTTAKFLSDNQVSRYIFSA